MTTAERRGHGQLVRELVQAALVELLTESFAGQFADPAAEAHKLVTKPGGMGLWFEEIARMATTNDGPVLERALRIVGVLRAKLEEHNVLLTTAREDKLGVAIANVMEAPNADLTFDNLVEDVTRRLIKFIEQASPQDLPANYADLRHAFEKDIRRIVGRLRYRKATADATDDALVCRAGFFLCQLNATWGQPVLVELNTLGSDIWHLLDPYREDETP